MLDRAVVEAEHDELHERIGRTTSATTSATARPSNSTMPSTTRVPGPALRFVDHRSVPGSRSCTRSRRHTTQRVVDTGTIASGSTLVTTVAGAPVAVMTAGGCSVHSAPGVPTAVGRSNPRVPHSSRSPARWPVGSRRTRCGCAVAIQTSGPTLARSHTAPTGCKIGARLPRMSTTCTPCVVADRRERAVGPERHGATELHASIIAYARSRERERAEPRRDSPTERCGQREGAGVA